MEVTFPRDWEMCLGEERSSLDQLIHLVGT